MTGETRMTLAVAGRKRQTVQTADCTSSGRVFQKMEAATENERRLAVDTTMMFISYLRPATHTNSFH